MGVEPASTEPDDVATLEQAATAGDWFPLQTEGNYWLLERKADAREISVDYVDGRIAYVSGLFPGDEGRWLGWSNSKPTELYLWDDGAEVWRLFVRFGRSVGATWKINGGACSTFTAKVTSKSAKVATPAGTFKKGYTVGFTHHPSPTAKCAAPFTSLTFVEGVGLVKLASPHYVAPVLLKQANVNGKAIGGGAELVTLAELEADPKAYDGKTITIVGEPAAGPMFCTKMACLNSNPCCNSCSAQFLLSGALRLTGSELGCSGNECAVACKPFAQSGNGTYAVTGVFSYGEYGSELAVQSYSAELP
jgi:hypothetical protein